MTLPLVATPNDILAGFEQTRISPMNENMFSDSEFSASYVTDRPAPANDDDNNEIRPAINENLPALNKNQLAIHENVPAGKGHSLQSTKIILQSTKILLMNENPPAIIDNTPSATVLLPPEQDILNHLIVLDCKTSDRCLPSHRNKCLLHLPTMTKEPFGDEK
ncbi:hypothetical protein JTB14_011204 [Gonioctena quinquepunctata]|nr:hypothetical protein JTB14_011204 [Gonioctena quinquepunctata]